MKMFVKSFCVLTVIFGCVSTGVSVFVAKPLLVIVRVWRLPVSVFCEERKGGGKGGRRGKKKVRIWVDKSFFSVA